MFIRIASLVALVAPKSTATPLDLTRVYGARAVRAVLFQARPVAAGRQFGQVGS